MNIHEYQAKQILKEFGAPITEWGSIFTLMKLKKKLKY